MQSPLTANQPREDSSKEPIKSYTIKDHFRNRAPEVKATYAAILKAAKKLGPVSEEAKKTSIHLVRKSAFAGVATRKSALILTLKSDGDVANKRVGKREHVSANRWYFEVKAGDTEASRWRGCRLAKEGVRTRWLTANGLWSLSVISQNQAQVQRPF